VHRDGKVELLSGFHLAGACPARETRVPSSVGFDLVGAEGRIIASRRCQQSFHQSTDDPYTDFHETLPWVEAIRAVVFWRDGDVIHTHAVEESPPRVRVEAPRFAEHSDVAHLEWTAEAPEGAALRYLVRYSHDDGESWRAVAVGLSEPHCDVDLRQLPGGDHCRLQVVASSGIRTAVAETSPFAAAVKPGRAWILSPADGTVICEGERLELYGVGFSPDFGTANFEDMVWSSDRDGLIDFGSFTVATNLSVGRHRIGLAVPDGVGRESVARVTIEVAASS
jgi:hypothetical protein